MPVRLSYSTLELLHTCERKFQLSKLLANDRREESEHLSFGAGFGAGIASYLQHKDADRAIYDAWLAYWPIIETDKKSQARMVIALERAFFELDNLLQDHELVYFKNKPACELSFRLDIDSDYYYVGYIDAVLRNIYTKQYLVFEVKTTGLLLKDLTPLYKHSGQALGYSITLDRIVGKELSSYGVLYFVAQMGKDVSDVIIHKMTFPKTLLDRLNWFIVLGLDVKHLKEMEQLQIYPRRGGSCLRFNKPCPQFGTCHLHSMDRTKEEELDPIAYEFVYELEDLVTGHLRRLQEDPSLGNEVEGECYTVNTSGEIFQDIDSLPSQVDPIKLLPKTLPNLPVKRLSLKELLAAKKQSPVNSSTLSPKPPEEADLLTTLLASL